MKALLASLIAVAIVPRVTAVAPGIIAPGVISTVADEADGALSPDGNTFAMTIRSAATTSSNVMAICLSQKRGTTWSTPTVAPFSGRVRDATPVFSADGEWIYFASTRTSDGGSRADFDLWRVRRAPGGWGEPERLPESINSTGNELSPSLADDGTLYYTSDRGGNYDIFVSDPDLTTTKALPEPVNTSFPELHVTVSPDGSQLVFSGFSRPDQLLAPGNPYSRGDLYRVRRTPNGWTEAEHLPPSINTAAGEIAPKFSRDGRRVLFSSDRSFIESGRTTQTYESLRTGIRSIHNGLGNLYEVALPDPQGNAFDAFRQQVRAGLATRKVPGAAVAIIRGDSVVFAEGFGVANVETREAVTADLLFQVGSSSKMFTAALVATLASESVIDLQAPVSRYVSGLQPLIGSRTTHQLLSQSAGIHDMAGGDGTEDESALLSYVRSWTPDFAMLPPALAFSYSNPGYALAGAVASEAARRPFADVMRARIFAPLGMTRTSYRPADVQAFPKAIGHRAASPTSDPEVVRQHANDTRIWPAGYAFSSVNEFARFVVAMLNPGRRGLSAEVIRAMMTPHITVPNIFADASYGYGLFLGPYRGHRSMWHDGQMPGFGAFVRMIPDRREGVIVMLNRENVRMEWLADLAFDALGVTQPPASPPRAKPLVEMSADHMAQIAGRYANRLETELVVRGGKLHRRFAGQEQQVFRIGDQRYTVDSLRTNPQMEFTVVPPSASHAGYVQMFLWALPRRG